MALKDIRTNLENYILFQENNGIVTDPYDLLPKLKDLISKDLDNALLYLKGSIPGSKNSEVFVKKSVKNINKLTILEKIDLAEKAKKTPDKKKK